MVKSERQRAHIHMHSYGRKGACTQHTSKHRLGGALVVLACVEGGRPGPASQKRQPCSTHSQGHCCPRGVGVPQATAHAVTHVTCTKESVLSLGVVPTCLPRQIACVGFPSALNRDSLAGSPPVSLCHRQSPCGPLPCNGPLYTHSPPSSAITLSCFSLSDW